VESVDFARAADLGNPLSFAEFASSHAALAEGTQLGSTNQLLGYVAERLVAQHLAVDGYDVSFPEGSNQPGWDLLVDGIPFQVKCGESKSLALEHVERYSDIPAIVNVELGESVGEMPGIYVDSRLLISDLRDLTEQGLAHGEALADFELPLIALAVSSSVEARALWRGEGQLESAIVNILTDTMGRVAVGTAGIFAGSALGLFLLWAGRWRDRWACEYCRRRHSWRKAGARRTLVTGARRAGCSTGRCV
jgi:hypothetical protein